MKAHAFAEIFPSMSEESYRALRESIRRDGLQEPITLYEGMILDGRHRWRACQDLGFQPPFVQYEGDNPLGFVVLKNLHRRHLDESQRAMVAARLARLEAHRPARGITAEISAVTQSDAGKLLNVSRESIQAARKVLQQGTPDLVKAVDLGQIAVSAAKSIAALTEKDQALVVLETNPRKRRELITKARNTARSKALLARERRSQERESLLLTPSPSDGSLGPITLEQWAKLGKEERAAALTCRNCGARLNPQDTTFIEWARFSWNPETGCLHDCPYCYARDIAEGANMRKIYPDGFAPTFWPDRLAAPFNTKVPDEAASDMSYRNVFVCSMADLFGKWVPAEWIQAVINVCKENPKWNFLMLTKFPQRAAEFEFPKNIWMGTTVDCQARVDNAEEAFEKIRCGTKWLSVEPMLTALRFQKLDLFQWLVIGGASPSTKTPALVPELDWIADLHVAARSAGLRVYYKTNCGMTDELRIREFPWEKPRLRPLAQPFRYLKGL